MWKKVCNLNFKRFFIVVSSMMNRRFIVVSSFYRGFIVKRFGNFNFNITSYLFKSIFAIDLRPGFSATFSSLIPSCSSYFLIYSALCSSVTHSLGQPALSCFSLSQVFTYSANSPVQRFSGVKCQTSWIFRI